MLAWELVLVHLNLLCLFVCLFLVEDLHPFRVSGAYSFAALSAVMFVLLGALVYGEMMTILL